MDESQPPWVPLIKSTVSLSQPVRFPKPFPPLPERGCPRSKKTRHRQGVCRAATPPAARPQLATNRKGRLEVGPAISRQCPSLMREAAPSLPPGLAVQSRVGLGTRLENQIPNVHLPGPLQGTSCQVSISAFCFYSPILTWRVLLCDLRMMMSSS